MVANGVVVDIKTGKPVGQESEVKKSEKKDEKKSEKK